MKRPPFLAAAFAAAFAAVVPLLSAAPPEGWSLEGSNAANYDSGVDPAADYRGLHSVSLKATADEKGFGTLMQSFAATNYEGKRVRFSAYVKSENVARWAGLWMRVDGAGAPPKTLGFDNMQDRPVKGTAGWKLYEVVLDVPAGAKSIACGILLDGPGAVWMNGIDLITVGSGTAVTGHGTPPHGPGPPDLK